MARLLERILAGAPRVVAFDMLFAEPDRLSWAAIADRLAEHAPEVGAQLRRLPGTDRSLAEFGGSAGPYLPAFPGALVHLPELEAAAAGRGSIGLPAELDNVVRRVPLLVRVGERVVPALAVEMLRVAAGESTILVQVDAAGIAAVTVGRRRIATDRNGIKVVHFAPSDPRRRVGAVELLEDPASAARGLELALALATCLLVLALVPRLGAVATMALGGLVATLLVGAAVYLFVERRLLIDTSFPALAGLVVTASSCSPTTPARRPAARPCVTTSGATSRARWSTAWSPIPRRSAWAGSCARRP